MCICHPLSQRLHGSVEHALARLGLEQAQHDLELRLLWIQADLELLPQSHGVFEHRGAQQLLRHHD